MSINLQQANRFLPHILLIGVGIGTANYLMNGGLNWIQWVIQSLVTSLLIGYTLVVIAANKVELTSYFKHSWQCYLCLLIAFFLTGVVASEVEYIIRAIVFSQAEYTPFGGGRIYGFNGILATVMGFSFFQYDVLFQLKNRATPIGETAEVTIADKPVAQVEPITKIPVKQGENIRLIPVDEIVYFEAFDNYAFLYNARGEKKLCDYSLLFLEQRLDNTFARIHRKYIVNTNYIKEIRPHLNGRYLILFTTEALDAITSSKSYAAAIRRLIKIE
ncbi:MAG: LytTR family DNA-binding domain-containing protein [Bacteroidota bacterium]